jgi:dUTP pyrophosphatase
MTTLKIFRIHPLAKLPKKATNQAACFDLSFQGNGHNTYEGFSLYNKNFKRVMNNQIIVQPGDRVMVPTGLIMDIPEGYSVRLHARSGTSLKQGLVLANAEGVIDSDYTQEVMVLVYNISGNPITISNGDRIAQAELIKDAEYNIIETATRPGVKGNRTGGMGSTGIVTNEGPTIVIKIPDETIKKVAEKAVAKAPEKKGRGRPRKNA